MNRFCNFIIQIKDLLLQFLYVQMSKILYNEKMRIFIDFKHLLISFKFLFTVNAKEMFLQKNNCRCFSLLFSKPLLLLVFQLPEKGPRPKWTIYKHDINKKCLSVISDFCLLSSVVRLQPTPGFTKNTVFYLNLS